MARDGNIRRPVLAENLIENNLGADRLVDVRFAVQGLPEGVILREPGFDLVRGERVVDVGLAAAAVAGVPADALAEEFFHCGDEGVAVREVVFETGEGAIGRL